MHFFVFVGLLALLISGCSTKSSPLPKHQMTPPSYKLKKKNFVTLTLYDEYAKWHGVPYKFGGTSHSGIDCSALVQSIYYDAFTLKIPRTTSEQLHIGTPIAKENLREGDILFFKTSYRGHHSAIYLERGNFINASSKYGVTLSNLNNPYWKNNYLQARRILNY